MGYELQLYIIASNYSKDFMKKIFLNIEIKLLMMVVFSLIHLEVMEGCNYHNDAINEASIAY